MQGDSSAKSGALVKSSDMVLEEVRSGFLNIGELWDKDRSPRSCHFSKAVFLIEDKW